MHPGFQDADVECGDGAAPVGSAVVAAFAVAGDRGSDLAGAHTWAAWRKQRGQDPPGDDPGCFGVVEGDAGRLDDLVAGGVQGDGEPAAVGIGAGPGFGRVDHDGAQELVEGEQGPHLLLDPGHPSVGRVRR